MNRAAIKVAARTLQARWMSEQIKQENVHSYFEDNYFFVPLDGTYSISHEIKNVITVVAKTSHYWQEHVANEVKNSIAWESRILQIWRS